MCQVLYEICHRICKSHWKSILHAHPMLTFITFRMQTSGTLFVCVHFVCCFVFLHSFTSLNSWWQNNRMITSWRKQWFTSHWCQKLVRLVHKRICKCSKTFSALRKEKTTFVCLHESNTQAVGSWRNEMRDENCNSIDKCWATVAVHS